MTSVEWQIREFRGRDGLLAVEASWKELLAGMAHAELCHDFKANLAYIDHLCHDPANFRCLTLADANAVVAVCPLEARSDASLRFGLPVWGLPWHPHWQISGVVSANERVLHELIPAVTAYLRRSAGSRPLVVFGPLPADSPLWQGLDRLPPSTYCLHDSRAADVFDCREPYDVLMARLTKHFRRNLRSHYKKLLSLDDVRLVTATDSADLATEFQAFMTVEASGWKGSSGTGSAILLHPELTAFYGDLAANLGREGRCQINSAYAEGRCIASQFCVRVSDEWAILKIGYDESYARVAPGLALLQAMLEQCCADPGTNRLSLVTDGSWQRDWQPDVVGMRQAHVAVKPLPGRSLVSLLRLRHGPAKRLAQRLRH
ncbi:MAG: GNAT family N-acetyltransferase [Gaiellales bacterium]|nr:GNAT family N-acetyltransferase [Gaiellales bacterium]